MVTIRLLSFQNNIAKIVCFPEGKETEEFYLTLDLEQNTIVENSLNKNGSAYVIHAAWKMFDEYNHTGNLPQTTSVAWY